MIMNDFMDLYKETLERSICVSKSIRKTLSQLYATDVVGMQQEVDVSLLASIEEDLAILDFNIVILFTQGQDEYFACLAQDIERRLLLIEGDIDILKTVPELRILKNSDDITQVCFAEIRYLRYFKSIDSIIGNLNNLNKKILL